MSLDDKFYTKEKGFIPQFDKFMIKQANKIAEYYENLTGKNYKDLTYLLYDLSLRGVKSTLLFGNFSALYHSKFIDEIKQEATFQSQLEEEFFLESLKLDKNCFKKRRTRSFLFETLYGASSYYFFNLDFINLSDSTNMIIDYFIFGIILSSLFTQFSNLAEYVSKIPPKNNSKRKKKKFDITFKYGIFIPQTI